MAHHFATNVLAIPDHRLIPCDHPDEALERILLSKLPRPAHLMLTDLPFALRALKENEPGISRALAASKDEVPPFDDVIAVRADLPPLLKALNQALEFLQRNGAVRRIADRSGKAHQGMLELLS